MNDMTNDEVDKTTRQAIELGFYARRLVVATRDGFAHQLDLYTADEVALACEWLNGSIGDAALIRRLRELLDMS
jgi:hypothetical protein